MDDLESLIARTALKYDLLPYTSNPFPQSQPGRVGAIGQLSGLEVAPLNAARVLELGCAAGGNIIPLAARNPQARFVGVDLSRTQVAAGRARIARLGLTNIEIHCQSFTELNARDGEFDYIICHGVYSWVPAPVREAILRICRERLSRLGIAYVSYNVLPGWRMLQALRDSLLLHVSDGHDRRDCVAQARQLLAIIKESSSDNGPYQQMFSIWSDRLAHLPDDYVAHDFLEEINEPCTLTDFVTAAERNGLGFLAEVDLPSMILDNYPSKTAAQARQMGADRLLGVEQYIDILTGRTFRQSLLIANERFSEVTRDISLERIDRLHFLTNGELRFERDADGARVSDETGRFLTTTSPVVMDLLERLIATHPASAALEELAPTSLDDGREEHLALARDALLKMTLAGLVTASSEPIVASIEPNDRPKTCRVAADDAARGEAFTTNLRHERIALSAVAQALLPKLDGATTLDELIKHLIRLGKEGRLHFAFDGQQVTDQERMLQIAREQTIACLQSLAKNALLIP
jgi:methyltransferase-like protein